MKQKGSAFYSPLLFCWIIRNWTQLQLNVRHSDRTTAVRVSSGVFSWELGLLLFLLFEVTLMMLCDRQERDQLERQFFIVGQMSKAWIGSGRCTLGGQKNKGVYWRYGTMLASEFWYYQCCKLQHQFAVPG